MKILFLTNLLPYPLDNGGKIKTYNTIRALSDGGNAVDLVCFTENIIHFDYANEMLQICSRVEQIELKLTTAENRLYMMVLAAKSLLSRYSFSIYKYRCKAMYAKLQEMINNVHYDCIYYDHLPLCVYKPYIDYLAPQCKTILDEHNCESQIMLRHMRSTRNLLKKVFLTIEMYKLRKFERNAIRSINHTVVLSTEDYVLLSDLCKIDFEHTIIPIGVQDKGLKKELTCNDKHMNLLFLGTLTWEPNNQGVIWFLRCVVPMLEKAKLNYTLYIVGKNPSDEVKSIASQYQNIVITGYVDSVDEYYDKCQAMIVPLFIGSGQRVKIIEAFSKGMPVISTTIGAEGLLYKADENILIADTEEEFADHIQRLYREEWRKKLSENGRRVYEREYMPVAIQHKFLNLINSI